MNFRMYRKSAKNKMFEKWTVVMIWFLMQNIKDLISHMLSFFYCLIKNTSKIMLHFRNFSRDRDSNRSQSWYLVTNMIKQNEDERIWRQDLGKQTYNSSH
jgi:hypothetical protein